MFDYKKILSSGPEIESRLKQLGALSETLGVPGIWRAWGTDSDMRAKKLLYKWFEEAGLTVREDAFGNIYGRLEGQVPETILTGSHIDTVKNGGLYDGACGVITALTAIEELKKAGWQPYYSVEVVGIEEEESSRFSLAYPGSNTIIGKFSAEELSITDEDGVVLRELMEERGYDWHRLPEASRLGEVKEFIELHIEQGAVLHHEGLSIGVVENITGMVSFDVTVYGEQNHAGTTPMYLRRDPLIKTAQMVLEMTETLREISPSAVITFGKMDLQPGVKNVIPGSVHFVIDLRDGKKDALCEAEKMVHQVALNAENEGFRVDIRMYNHEDPVEMNQEMADCLEESVREAGFSYKRMNSGAGHDSMVIGRVIPTCMIFIPSVKGISHSPEEYTSPEDLGKGCETLSRLLVKRGGLHR